MELGNEIGQKIRSAIKAKLVELGAYVDDELPDYIMVMVANKKTEAQMAEDLNLFLSANTHKFTSWLHHLLDKLQMITNEPPAAPVEMPLVARKSTENQQQQLQLVTIADNKLQLPVVTPVEQTVPPVVDMPVPPGVDVTKQSVLPVDVKREPEFSDDPLLSGIRLGEDHDEFDEESLLDDRQKVRASPVKEKVETSAVKQLSSVQQTVASVVTSRQKETRKVSVTAFDTRKRPVAARDDEQEEEYIPQPVKVARTEAKMRLGSSAPPSNRSSATVRPTSRRRHGALSSSVGAVLRHNYDDDEEYDPNRPAIGNVASVVRVNDRKSSVPVTLQANRSLLLKAMKQAEQSVSRARKLSDASLTDELRISALSRIGLQSSSARKALQSQCKITVKNEICDSVMSEEVISKSPNKQDTITEDLRMVATAQSSDHEEQVVDQFESEMDMEDAGLDTSEHGMDSVDEENSDDDGIRQLLLLQNRSKEDNRKFVVTLQDDNTMEDNDMIDDDQEMILQSTNTRNVVRVKPQAQFTRGASSDGGLPIAKKSSERCKFWPSCKNADACQFHHPSVPCRSFPSCRFGDSCMYIHPHCKFDTVCRNPRCPYTHSTPRRPAALTTPVPVIVHPIRVPVYIPGPPPYAQFRPSGSKQIRCKFFPNCADVNCQFMHPKSCHYGANCANRNSSCPFTHPDWPDKKQMKWTAPSVNPTTP